MAAICRTDCPQIKDFSSDISKTSDGPPTVLRRANDPVFTMQVNTRPEMVFISQPKTYNGGIDLTQLNREYIYDPSAGGSATVYKIDSIRWISNYVRYILTYVPGC